MSKPKSEFSASFFITVWAQVPLNSTNFDDAFEEAKQLCDFSADEILKRVDGMNDWSVRLGSVSNLTESGGL